MFQWRVLHADYAGKLGLALAHPLYIFLGKILLLILLGSSAAKVNALSGIGMAVGLANMAIIGHRLTGRLWIGIATASMLSVTHTVWWLSTIAEVYTWNAAFFTAELLALISLIYAPRWHMAAALFLINGLNVSLHNLALLALPVYGFVLLFLVAQKRLPVWTIIISVCAYSGGVSPYIAMTAALALAKGDVLGAVRSALFGNYASEVFNSTVTMSFGKINAALASLNFINFFLPFASIGWLYMKRRNGSLLAAALGAITIIEFLFYVRYPVPDQFTFIVPSLVMISLAAAVGIDILADVSPQWRRFVIVGCLFSMLVPPFAYAAGPKLIRNLGLEIKRDRELPFRDEVRYWMVPWKQNEPSAELFAQAALQQAAPLGIIICDSTSYYPLLLVQRRDRLFSRIVIMTDGEFRSHCEKNPLYPAALSQKHTLFLVSPALIFLPPGIKGTMTYSREAGRVLFCITVTDTE
ncbi:MAG: hypothetical protein WCQ99_09265, partial [Pseudomonadota bacterium]